MNSSPVDLLVILVTPIVKSSNKVVIQSHGAAGIRLQNPLVGLIEVEAENLMKAGEDYIGLRMIARWSHSLGVTLVKS